MLGLLSAAILLVASAGAYVALFDVNQYKGDLVALVEASTGRAFSIRGDIRLKLSLVPTVAVDDVTFGNAAWAAHEQMMSVEHIEARLALIPLLRGKLALKRLTFVGGRISIETNAKGLGNWVLDLDAADDVSSLSSNFPRFDLHEIEIRRTVVEYRAPGAAMQEISIDALTLRSEGFGQPLVLEAKAVANEVPIALHGRVSAVRRLVANEPYALDLTAKFGAIEISLKGEIRKPLHGRGMKFLVTIVAPTLAQAAAPFDLDLPQTGPVTFTAVVSDTKKGYALRDVAIQAGATKLDASLDLERSGDQWRVRGTISASEIILNDFATSGGPPPGTRERLFSDQALSVDRLRDVAGQVDFSVARLVSEYVLITDLKGKLTVNDGVLEINPLVAKIGDGTLRATIEVDGSSATPAISLDVKIAKMSLNSLPKLAASGRVSRGPTDLSLLLAGKGESVAAIMANANGSLLVNIGAATFDNEALSITGSDLLMSFFAHLNPKNSSAGVTYLECAVIKFPIVQGVARNETGIGLQTRTLSILGGGTVNLKTEGIDIGAKPKPREGLGINLTSLADFVRLGGTLTKPRLVTDAKGATTAGLKVGAAVATAGLSLLAEGLYDRATADADVCAIARGEDPLAPGINSPQQDRSVFQSTTSKAKDVLENAGAKVKGLFKGLFGD